MNIDPLRPWDVGFREAAREDAAQIAEQLSTDGIPHSHNPSLVVDQELQGTGEDALDSDLPLIQGEVGEIDRFRVLPRNAKQKILLCEDQAKLESLKESLLQKFLASRPVLDEAQEPGLDVADYGPRQRFGNNRKHADKALAKKRRKIAKASQRRNRK